MSAGRRPLTLQYLADAVGGTLEGPPDLLISSVGTADEAGPGSIVRVDHSRWLARARESPAAALILPEGMAGAGKPAIRTANPRLAFLTCLTLLHPEEPRPEGIHPTAVLGEGVTLGESCRIEAHAVLDDGATLGERVTVGAGAYVGRNCRIGDDSRLFPRVVLMDGTHVGSRVRIHPGTVIGADGFGYEWDGTAHRRIPQVGSVRIEDDVEIGANTTIDRATVGETVIGAGSRIDNLVQIAHNVRTGRHCLIVSQTGIAGSTRLGNGVVLAGQCGVKDNINVGDGVRAAGRTAIWADQPPGVVLSGHPARPHGEDLRIQVAVGELPAWRKRLKEIEARLAALETPKAEG